MLSMSDTLAYARLNFTQNARVDRVAKANPDPKNRGSSREDEHPEQQEKEEPEIDLQLSEAAQAPFQKTAKLLRPETDPPLKPHSVIYSYQSGRITVKAPPEDYKGHHLDLTG